jgi:hypothetical protein
VGRTVLGAAHAIQKDEDAETGQEDDQDGAQH